MAIAPSIMPTAPDVSARFFQGLSDPTRIRILYILLEGDRSVGELVEMLGSPQGRVSSHLACLRYCSLAVAYRRGQKVFYTITDPRVRELLSLSREILVDNAERVIACQVLPWPGS